MSMNHQNQRVVTIGGGTGSFTILTGLKRYPFSLSAIVSMADDGGSTGVLRDELGVLPPGDVRQCLVALSESSEMLRNLMNYRFDEGSLKGHSFGNLFLSALEKVTGSFGLGVEAAMEILKVRGEVVPVTDDRAELRMTLVGGDILEGENEINHSRDIIRKGVSTFGYISPVRASERTIDRISSADLIVIGPGNLYCSLLPNLIVKGVSEAIAKASADVVFVSNLTNRRGQTDGWDVPDYVRAIERHIGEGRVDSVVWNGREPAEGLIRRYESQEGLNVIVGAGNPGDSRTYRLLSADVVSDQSAVRDDSDAISDTRALIRHDPEKLARAIANIVAERTERFTRMSKHGTIEP